MLDVFDAEFAADPWPVLDRLRRDGGVHRVRTPDGPPAWMLTRYDDVRAVLLDSRLSTRISHAGGEDYSGFAVPAPLNAMLTAEPDDHARIRSMLTAELAPRRLTEWTRPLADLVATTLSGLTDGPADLIAQVAVPLPAALLGELLGLGEAQTDALLNWAKATLLPSVEPPRARDTLATMKAIITDTLNLAQTRGGDTMLTRLLADHGPVSAEEAVGLLFYLLFVWYEVLVDLIGGGVLALLTHRRNTAPVPPMVVEELLRFVSPQVLAAPRFALSELRIGGHTITKGQTILACLAGANHDPAQFENPDTLDLARSRNPHLGLGYGGHACLGAALVRTITATVLDQLFTRWPSITLAVGNREVLWRSGFRHRGPLTLSVTLS
jgi:cytochrome P450